MREGETRGNLVERKGTEEELIVPLHSPLLPLLLCLVCTCPFALAGCATPTPTATPEPIELRLATVPHLSRLAQELTGDFSQTYRYVTFRLSVTSSQDALAAVANRDIDVALIAEPVNRGRDVLEATKIGDEAIVIAVHASNPVQDLTWSQIREIFSGQVWNWSTVDPNRHAQEIVVVTQHDGAVSRLAFDAQVLEDLAITPRALVATGDQVTAQTISGEPAAIGYLLAGLAGDGVRVLSVEGTAPPASIVASANWPITRPVNLVTHIDANVYALDFLDFAEARFIERDSR